MQIRVKVKYLLFNLNNMSEDLCPLLECAQEHLIIWLLVIRDLVGCRELALSVGPILPLKVI